MRLTDQPATTQSPDDLAARAFAALDRRLLAAAAAPVAVAASGGGDSMALLALACDWGRARGRPILALSVDHGLQPGSDAWSRLAAESAQRLGAQARILRWQGPKPAAGLPAAARAARHRLLAEAAREAGAAVILLAHTADDAAEAELMRAEGSTLGAPVEWSPTPAWPEGRGLFLLRPLLEERRADLRALLAARGLDWIEDPANADPKYARSRARAALSGALNAAPQPGRAGARQARPRPASIAWEEVGGGLRVDRASLAAADAAAARRFLSAALLSAAGTTRPPRGDRLQALLQRLLGPDPVAATLAGARVQASADAILLARELPRGGLAPFEIEPGSVSVWDGRFEISAAPGPFRVVPAAGRMARLSAPDRKEILALAPILRGSQPLLIGLDATKGPPRPVLAARLARVRALAGPRLRAACGLIAHERDIASPRVAPGASSSYVVGKRLPKAAAN